MANIEKFDKMTKKEALEYCYLNKNKYIKDFDDIEYGLRGFNCLIELIESETISINELPDYGMDY